MSDYINRPDGSKIISLEGYVKMCEPGIQAGHVTEQQVRDQWQQLFAKIVA